MVKRNEKQNVDRKFKDITVGDRIFIKNNIRKHKFVQRFTGPFRVIGLKGSTVFCYSLASKKHKQVTMDKVRYVGDLFQDDTPNILQAFPEDEPVVDDEILDPSLVSEHPNTCKQTTPILGATSKVVKSRDPNMNILQGKLKAQSAPVITHTYNLRRR